MNYRYIENLPVYEKRSEIVNLIRSEQVIIISGETGCGKTTQLPLFCLEAGRGNFGRIGCTQPRRVAAQSLAKFLSTQFENAYKDFVGYKVRFQENVHEINKIKFMTDGVLLAEASANPMLSEYDTIIIDEVHERTVNIDLLLGYLKNLLCKRPELHLILSSATFDTSLFSRFFNNAPVILIDGRLFPVEVKYKPVIELWKGESLDSYVEGVVCNVQEIIQNDEQGDILVFLPTVDYIYDTINKLHHRVPSGLVQLLALHSRISFESQQRIFDKSAVRKIIVATNVAETSITVPGIRYVIDSGLARVLRYDSKVAISRMPIEKISRSSANQRAGRCGRVQNGICIRLYSEQDFISRPQYTLPEIKRANCAGVILRMYQLNPGYVKRFPYVQNPPQLAISEGYRLLRELGAFDRRGNLTIIGKKMAELPLDPSIARILLYSIDNGSFPEVAIIAAALSVDRLTLADENSGKNECITFRDHQSDFMTFVNIWNKLQKYISGNKNKSSAIKLFCEKNGFSHIRIREWINIHSQIVVYCKKKIYSEIGTDHKNGYEKIHKSLLTGMFNGVAVKVNDMSYEGVTTGNIRLFPGSTLFRKSPEWVLCHEIVETGHVYGRYAAVIKPQWIEYLFRKQCRYLYNDAWYDIEEGCVKSREEVIWNGLTLIKNRVLDLKFKDRQKASDVFIREALVNELAGEQYRFIAENRKVKFLILSIEKKLRSPIYGGDVLLESFYEERLNDVCSQEELLQSIRAHGNDSFLIASIKDLTYDEKLHQSDDFPDYCTIAGKRCECRYIWDPEKLDDGITIIVDDALYLDIPAYYWDWVLPELIKKRMEIIINILDCSDENKEQLLQSVLDESQAPSRPFWDVIEQLLETNSIRCNVDGFQMLIPEYLWCRIEVKNRNGVTALVERTPLIVRVNGKNGAFCECMASIVNKYECEQIRWHDPDILQPHYMRSEEQLVPLCGYPALFRDGFKVLTRIFLDKELAYSSHVYAIEHLIEAAISEELAWCADSTKVMPLISQNFQKIFKKPDFGHYFASLVVRYTIGDLEPVPLNEIELNAKIESARNRVKSSGMFLAQIIEKIVTVTESVMVLLNKRMQKNSDDFYQRIIDDLSDEMDQYISSVRCENTPIFFLERIPQFLTTFSYRIDAAFYDYSKYCHKMSDIRFYKNKFPIASSFSELHYCKWIKSWKIRFYVEEYVSTLFTRSTIKLYDRVTLEQIKKLVELF